MTDEPSQEDKILTLYKEGNWREMLKTCDRNKFLPWIWPSERNLTFIGKCAGDEGAKSIISIGCGSGLLEWLLQMATGLPVVGVELNGVYWTTKYSSGSFIPLVLVTDPIQGQFHTDTEHSALLFCYFNHLNAFLNYMDNFKGNSLIIIGPGEGRGTYTVPKPFELPEEIRPFWNLREHQEIDSSKDLIAVYTRALKK